VPDKRSGAGHLLIALNVEVFQPLAAFNERVEAMIAGLKGAKLAKASEEIFYPGEIEARNAKHNRADGLLLPVDTIADLTKLGQEMQIPFIPL
jgi:LDH2 family malate/lactate/ureidoglycolate dehydrogenase